MLESKRKEIQQQYKSAAYWSEENLREVVEAAARAENAAGLPLLDFQAFQRKSQTHAAV